MIDVGDDITGVDIGADEYVPDLMAHWPLDDNDTSTNVNDVSGWNNTGTANQNTSLLHRTSGKDGCFLFDGIDDYVEITRNELLSITDEVTLAAWVKASAMPATGEVYWAILSCQQDKIYSSDLNTASGLSLFLVADTNGERQHVMFQIGAGEWYASTATEAVSPNEWVHIIATRKTNEPGVIYYNGVAQSITCENSWDGSVEYVLDWNIGRQSDVPGGRRYFDGLIDDVRIYNRALSAAEVQELYIATQGNYLSGHWTMDDNALNQTVTDSAGSHDGQSVQNTSSMSVTGQIDSALEFNGSSDYVEITRDQSLSITGEVTLSAWIKIPTIPLEDIWAIMSCQQDKIYGSGIASGLSLFLDNRDSIGGVDLPNPRIQFQIGNEEWYGLFNTGNAVPANQWVHIVATRKAGEDGIIYIDGSAETIQYVIDGQTGASWDGSVEYVLDWNIGRQSDVAGGRRYFNGQIDDVRIYNRALSALEVQVLYSEGVSQ
jgi:hypothetical protein